MSTPIFTLSAEMSATWDDIMIQMEAFVNDTNADVDMAYDWVCEMLDIDSFVDNEIAWNSFYNCWESCDNRNDLNTFQIAWLTLTFFPLIHNNMQETKFNIYGEMFHQNGYSRFDVLSYIAPTQQEAIANCKRNNPGFHVMSCWVDDSEPEVVRLQPLR